MEESGFKSYKKISNNILNRVVNARIEEIIDLINQDLIFLRSKNVNFNKILVTGEGSKINGFHAILKEKLHCKSLSIEKFHPKIKGDVSDNFDVCMSVINLIINPYHKEIPFFSKKKEGFFEKIYLVAEPALLNEIERQRARDAVRVWIRQKLNCLNEKYRCGRDERKMIKRLTNFETDILKTYQRILKNLDKKLFPEEQTATFIKTKDLETLCGFVDAVSQNTPKPGMLLIDTGKFKMGSSEGLPTEHPVREVQLDEFWIDKCEVTNYQYLRIAAQHPFLRKSTFPRKFHDGNYLRNVNNIFFG
jgi:hypothetical protein